MQLLEVPTIPPIPKHYMDVPGFNNEAHNESLQETARLVQPGSKVLEVGTAWGRSTWSLLDSLPSPIELHVLDSFIHLEGGKIRHYEGCMKKHADIVCQRYALKVFMEEGQRACWDWSLKQHPRMNTDKIVVHQMLSEKFRETDDIKWDLVYLDACHSYQSVSGELNKWTDCPILCGDDYHPVHKGVVKAVDEFLAKHPERQFWHDTPESRSGFFRILA
ncbi:hypothetical protein LCGC14_1210850 [marine sediment metagenome]|uniref:Methyltransferase domain-containing protein n=1 Tax=marine sediment metagenome TaxID=412755 RepID=A0A0F9NWD4_9ZZZZ